MSLDACWHLVSYDVRDDKRRRRAAKLLLGYGERVQYSVIRLHVSRRTLLHVRWQLARLLDPADSVLFIPLPDVVARQIQRLDEADDWTQVTPPSHLITGSQACTPGARATSTTGKSTEVPSSS